MTLVQKEIKGVYVRKTEQLPVEYQQVEYIEITGTQYIDTGLYAGSNIQTETKIEKTVSEQAIPVFGSVQGTYLQADHYYCFIPYNNEWYWGINNSEGHGGSYTDAIGTQYTIVYNDSNSQAVVDGTQIGSTAGTQLYNSSYTLGIGVRRASNQTRLFGKFKYFYFRMFDKTTGKYVRNMIPCYRIADSVIGMYDLVNNQFYTNSGSGTLTKGADVSTPILTEHKIRPADTGWQPGPNTIAYYNFNNQNLNDSSGNSNNASWKNGTGSYISVAGGYCANLGGSHAIQLPFTIGGLTSFTMNEYINIQGFNKSSTLQGILGTAEWTSGCIHSNISNSKTWEIAFGGGGSSITYATGMSTNTWYNIGITKNGTTYKMYINGTPVASGTGTGTLSSAYTWYIGTTYTNDRYLDGYLDNVIFENKTRSDQDMLDYYNLTKSDYGL